MPVGSVRWKAALLCAMPLLFALPSACENGAHAEESPDTLWSREVQKFPTVPSRVVIAGTRKEGKFMPSYVVLPDSEEREPSEVLPWLTNLLPLLSARPFGQEERATISRAADGSLALECTAGAQPAGMLLAAPGFHYPRGFKGELVIDGLAHGGLSVALVDIGTDARSAVVARDGGLDDVLARIPSQAWEQGGAAKQLVVACSQKAAKVDVRGVRIVPSSDRQATGMGTWLWDVVPWLDQPERLVALARSRNVNDLFVQIRIENGRIVAREKLMTLLDRLTAAGISVHPVEGDPEMATPAGRVHALDRARILRTLYAEAGDTLKPAQYDIEPYILPQFDSDPARSWHEWAVSVEQLSQVLEHKVSVAVPFWMLSRAAGRDAIVRARGAISSVVVMAYRTDIAELEAIAGKWLDWGNRQGVTIQIALENGPLPIEYHRAYVLAENGEVRLERTAAVDRIVLLKDMVPSSSTRPVYSFTKETEVNPKRISFMNDRRNLNEVLRNLGRNLPAFASFGGVLVHEIMIP